MRKTLIVAAGIGVLLADVAWAQNRDDEGLQVGDYAPAVEAGDNNKAWINVASADERPSMTELRGLVVVLFFWVSWHEGGEFLLPYVNMLSYNPMGQTPHVYFIGVTDADRKVTQPLLDDAKVFFPVAVESKAAEEYGLTGDFGFVVIDPEGKIAYKGSGSGDLGGMSDAVTEALENSPPFRTHPDEAKFCYRAMDEAYDLIVDEKYAKAFRLAEEAFARSVLGDRLRSRTMELVDLIEQLGYDDLAAAEPFLERRKYNEAAEVLREVVRRFRRLDCYKDAKALYEKLREEDEDFKEAAGKFDEEDTAARLYLEARDDLKARRFGDSYTKLNEIVTDYPNTEAAEYAEAMIQRMKRNRAFWIQIEDHKVGGECRMLLARARNLKKQRRYREAEEVLRRIMTEYPDTIWAEEAVEELKNMPSP
ncbi:MAG: hypothetical protein ACYSVY_16945 [Planctomycetota bacterium]|jgi:tetratricopeptide (TPR) repeat protein